MSKNKKRRKQARLESASNNGMEPESMSESPAPKIKPLSSGKRIIFSLLPVILLLALGETAARLSGKDFTSSRFFYLAGGHEEYFGTEKRYVPYEAKPPYYWTGVPNVGFFNQYGFRGKNWSVEKPPDTTRIAVMGCSVTLGGVEPYADRIERLLNEAVGAQKYEALNFGIGSSSTHQILQIFEQQALRFRPDVATLFSGWNDRWVHDGRRDAAHKLPSAARSSLWDFLTLHSRLFRAMVYVADARANPQQRVPPIDYAHNLRTFVRLCRDNRIKPILCTTPDGMPDMAILSRFNAQKNPRDWDSDLYDIYRNKADGPIATWHYIQKLYNDTVLQVSKSERVDVLDLDTKLAARRKAYEEPPFFFFKDGIHMTELGLQELAVLFAQQVAAQTDRPALDTYIESPAYFVTNAWRFAGQFEYYVADEFLKRAEERQGSRIEGVAALRAEIATNEAFYKTFDLARIEWSDRGDLGKVSAMLDECLQMRPEDPNLRLEAAGLASERNEYDKALQLALGSTANYTQENLYKALWLGAEVANRAKRVELVVNILRTITQQFPQDQQARQLLQDAGL